MRARRLFRFDVWNTTGETSCRPEEGWPGWALVTVAVLATKIQVGVNSFGQGVAGGQRRSEFIGNSLRSANPNIDSRLSPLEPIHA